MPNVDTNAPLVTNSDAAMWRQDHDAAKRYIEALLAERKRWAGVMEAARAYFVAESAYADTWKKCYGSPTPTDEQTYATELLQWHERRAAHDALMAALAALKEGNTDG